MKENKTNNDFNSENLEIEELNEEMLEAYLNISHEQIPDLWDRIEAGYEKEIQSIKSDEEKNCKVADFNSKNSVIKKSLRKKYIGLAAAVLLMVVIAIPVAGVIMNNNSKKSDNSTTGEMFDGCEEYYDTEAAQDIMCESAIQNSQDNSKSQTFVGAESESENVDVLCNEMTLRGTLEYDEKTYVVTVSEILSGECEEVKEGSLIYIKETDKLKKLINTGEVKIDGNISYEITICQLTYDNIDNLPVFKAEITEIK